MRIGIHTSTRKSLAGAALKAAELGANTFQVFSASPRMWRANMPDQERVRLLCEAREKHDLWPLVIHGSYLINLAAPEGEIRRKSVLGFAGEIERALVTGAEYLVIHPGNYKGLSTEQGISNVAEAIVAAWQSVERNRKVNPNLSILLENTAGAGAQLGGNLQELAYLRQLVTPNIELPVGVCLDTCHCFVAGFNIATGTGLRHFLREADRTVGLANVPVFHANDAKAKLGSRLDRHASIGAGHIGLEGFRRILNHPKLRNKAFILETPVDHPGDDARNVATLKELVSLESLRVSGTVTSTTEFEVRG